MKQRATGNRRKQRRPAPTREEINKAMEEYTRRGGKIKLIAPADIDFDSWMRDPEPPAAVDEFLTGA